jgi:hypothetical protein
MNDDVQSLWRYLDLPKFMSLLEDAAIYCGQIRRFIDHYEGFIHDDFYRDLNTSMGPPFVGGEEIAVFTARNAVERILDSCFVSCWHLAENESPLMWAEYAGTSHSVAIKTNTQALAEAFSYSKNVVRTGCVTYEDLENETAPREIPSGKQYVEWFFGKKFSQIPSLIELLEDYRFVFRKRTLYGHEREYRVVVVTNHGVDFDQWKSSVTGIGFEYGTLGALNAFRVESERELARTGVTAPSGISVPVNLMELLTAVHTAPGSGAWFDDLLRKVMKRYGLQDIPIVESRL